MQLGQQTQHVFSFRPTRCSFQLAASQTDLVNMDGLFGCLIYCSQNKKGIWRKEVLSGHRGDVYARADALWGSGECERWFKDTSAHKGNFIVP